MIGIPCKEIVAEYCGKSETLISKIRKGQEIRPIQGSGEKLSMSSKK
jgi:hypothetical protein